MNLSNAAYVYAGLTQGKAAYYNGKKIWSMPGWLPSGILDTIKGFWRLNDDGSGGLSLLDTSGNNKTLVNYNNVALGSGIINGAANITSSGQYLKAIPGNAFWFGTEFTVSMWVNISSLKDKFCLVGGNGTGTIAIYGDASGNLYLNNGTLADVQVNNFFTLNTWTHCVFRRRFTNNIEVWKNGSLVYSQASKISVNSYNYTDVYLGSYPGRPTEDYQFLGRIDAVGLWQKYLFDDLIYQLYNAGYGFEI